MIYVLIVLPDCWTKLTFLKEFAIFLIFWNLIGVGGGAKTPVLNVIHRLLKDWFIAALIQYFDEKVEWRCFWPPRLGYLNIKITLHSMTPVLKTITIFVISQRFKFEFPFPLPTLCQMTSVIKVSSFDIPPPPQGTVGEHKVLSQIFLKFSNSH